MLRPRALCVCVALSFAACAHAERGTIAQGDEATKTEDEAPLLASFRHAYDSSELAAYQSAKDEHAAWLSSHADSPHARDVRARYGKLLFALGEYEAAAAAFEKVADLASGRAPDYSARGAMRNRVLALVHFV